MSKQSELVEAIMELNNEGDDWDAQHIGELIAEWHKKHELQARIDELKRAKSLYSRTYKQEVFDNAGNVYVNDSHGYISSYEVQERIAELKAQQEEV